MRKVMKIVHVDDNKFALNEMQKDISQIVPEAELHSFQAPNPALAFAEAQGCDVLMTELELWTEKHGGIRLAKAIEKLNPQVNIIFVTVCNECEVSRELSELCISGFIPKPWEPEKLTAVFRNLLYQVKSRTYT